MGEGVGRTKWAHLKSMTACVFVCGGVAYLVDGQVDTSIGDDAQQVGDVAPVEGDQPFLLSNLPRAIKHPAVLASLAQR